MKIYKLILILVTLLFCLRVADAGPECPARVSVRVTLNTSSAVFSGEVVSEEYRDTKTDSLGRPAEAKVLVVKLKVQRWWKGSGAEEVYLLTSVRKYPDGTMSLMGEDFLFAKGESYLVYARGHEEKLWTDGCTRTRKLAEAGEDLRELGEGKVPEKKESTSSDLPSSAEHPSGRIRGVILDANKARVVNATVKVESGQVKCNVKSGEKGDFDIRLPAGSYRITVDADGFRQFVRSPLEVKADQTEVFDIHLIVAEPPGLVPASDRRVR